MGLPENLHANTCVTYEYYKPLQSDENMTPPLDNSSFGITLPGCIHSDVWTTLR